MWLWTRGWILGEFRNEFWSEFWMSSGWCFRTLIFARIFLVLPTRQNHPWNLQFGGAKCNNPPKLENSRKWRSKSFIETTGKKIHPTFIPKFIGNSSWNSPKIHPSIFVFFHLHVLPCCHTWPEKPEPSFLHPPENLKSPSPETMPIL